VLSKKCHVVTPPLCLLSKARLDATQGFPQTGKPKQLLAPAISTSVVHVRKRASTTPICVSDVRRSPRLTAANKGYRAKTYFDKNCLACASAAPPIKKICNPEPLQQIQYSSE
jgi:hypothetical protein